MKNIIFSCYDCDFGGRDKEGDRYCHKSKKKLPENIRMNIAPFCTIKAYDPKEDKL